ncbi:MAG TPA: proton-conducting transporter membrane subunit, partial [Candidatus Binataceae bacterium]|nr:proton-conducting transporter membrane subunit [Candidatus Binataceae bacterium]
MSVEFSGLGLILLFPLLGVLFNVFLGARFGRGAVNLVGPGVMFLSFAAAIWAFVTLLTMPSGSALTLNLWDWIQSGDFHVDVILRVDALSGVMLMVVTGVGAFIHLYSVGYMAHDEDYARFFAYLNLFALSMLVLVLASSILLMFVGWEGVGLCSYLLIGFWYPNPEFARNGRKAFVVNRIGDAGFVLGMLTIIVTLARHGVWTVEFTEIGAHAALFSTTAATAAC